MGFLSKLFGNEAASSAAKEFLKDIMQETAGSKPAAPQQNEYDGYYSQPAAAAVPSAPSASGTNAPFGVSWSDTMPSEPNQFNSGVSYHDYFESVYKEAFPQLEITKELPANRNAAKFRFYNNGALVLAVEVISQTSSPYALRRECAKAHVPYLCFYHNHHGWWNTKQYVVNRTKHALGI